MRRNREISTLWWNIIDIIGPSKKWPKAVRKQFWQKNWNHEERIKVAVFVYINGVNPLICMSGFNYTGISTAKVVGII